MKGQWADWIAVGLAVAGAAIWLGWRVYRQWKQQRNAKGIQSCTGGCEGCPFGEDCTGRGTGK